MKDLNRIMTDMNNRTVGGTTLIDVAINKQINNNTNTAVKYSVFLVTGGVDAATRVLRTGMIQNLDAQML